MSHITSAKIKALEHKTRWFSPQFFSDSDSLMCISVDPLNHVSIIIYDISSGEMVDSFLPEEFSNVFCPVWINEHEIACIVLDKQGKHIITYDLSRDVCKNVYSSGYKNIDNLSAGGDFLFFSADYELAKNIYAVNLNSKKVFRVTNSRHGADFPFYDSTANTLFYSDYTLEGYQPAYLEIDTTLFIPIDSISAYHYPWVGDVTENAYKNLQKARIPQYNYTSKSYNRLFHAFNIHSWLPFYTDPDAILALNPLIYPGFTLFSQNKLSTVTAQFSYYYRKNIHYFEPRLTLQGIYPVIEISGRFANKPSIYFWPDNLDQPENMQPFYSIAVSTSFPMQLTRNRYSRFLRPGVSYRYLNRYYYTRNTGTKRGYNYLEASIYASNLLKQSHRDLQPRFGQTLYLAYNSPIIQPEIFTKIVIGQYNQYLPGIFRHHGIRLNISFEYREDKKIQILNNRILPPRGYDPDLNYFRNLRGTIEYTLPILYPDLSFGPIAYVKRFHTTLYYDAAKIRYLQRIDNNSYLIPDDYFSSFGVILYAEVHLLRFFIPFQPGLRISFLPEEQLFNVGFSVNINTSVF